MKREKIVLAYSGGLDTSVLVRVLSVDYGYDVVCCHADVGEARDAKALASIAPPDVTVDRIGDLLDCDLGRLLTAAPRLEAARR